MDKADAKIQENQSDTSSVITMKEYASSEYPGSEPPPAYIKPRSVALRIARLVAFTVIASSVILGGFILAASWIQANAARNLDLTLNQELLDDLQPGYEQLIAEQILPEKSNQIPIREEKDEFEKRREEKPERGLVPPPIPTERPQEKKSLELEEIANMLIKKNAKGNVNCIIEKRRNEELVDHAPRSLGLPFGLNITTPPRLQHVTGEQMVVVCKNDQEERKDQRKFQGSGMPPVRQFVRPRMPPMQRPVEPIYHGTSVYEPREIPMPMPFPPAERPAVRMPFRNEEEIGPFGRSVPNRPFPIRNFGNEEPRFEPPFPLGRFPFPAEVAEERPAPAEERFPFPFPSRRPEPSDDQPFSQFRREPKIVGMIPLRVESLGPVFPGSRVRFPSGEEPGRRRGENGRPVVAEITKIIPLGTGKEGSEANSITADEIEETGPFPSRAFPIPIDAILEAVLKGVGVAANDPESDPAPVDVKIERIEAEPGKPAFLEKLEILEKRPLPSEGPESRPRPEPSTLMIEDAEKGTSSSSGTEEEKQGKSQPITKSEEKTPQAVPTAATVSSSPDGSFLPDGTGRGAGVFPIPRGVSETEIFTVSDAASAGNRDLRVPVGFSVSVADPGTLPSSEGRRGKAFDFERPVEGEINLFPRAEGRAMNPQPVRAAGEIRSVRLYPVASEKYNEQEDARPHYVQPRSV